MISIRSGLKMLRLSLQSLLCIFILTGVLWAQSGKTTQQTFSAPKPQVERALRQLAGSSGGKLPILVGFAVPGDHSLERFRQGHYEYEIAITAINARETAVQVSAKITAWYAGEKPEESNYEVLGSNGRLESDLLDRLADVLKSSDASVQPLLAPVGTDTHRAPDPRPDAPSTAKINYLSQYLRSATPKTEGSRPAPAQAEPVTDQQISKLTREEAALEQIKSSQARPSDLAIVKAAKTPVLSRPSRDAQVVLVAEADDELQVLDVNNDWVHVHLMGLSRGWVRRSQLDLSNVSLPATAAKQTATTSQDQRFQKTREETGTFPGEWKPLQGKKVDIVWVQERDEASPPSESGEMRFFESLMRKQYAALTAEHNEVEGVVLVLDSANGGMIASTNSALQRWTAGSLSNDSFWRECWFDPPDIFQSLRQGK
jgi:hypothetical protein